MTSKRDLRNRITLLEERIRVLHRDVEHWRRRCQTLAHELHDTDVPALRGQLRMLEDDRLALIERVNTLTSAPRFGHVEGRPDGHPDVKATRPVVPNYTPRRTGFNPIDGGAR